MKPVTQSATAKRLPLYLSDAVDRCSPYSNIEIKQLMLSQFDITDAVSQNDHAYYQCHFP